MIIFVINCLPSTKFDQEYLLSQQIAVISWFLTKSPIFIYGNLESLAFENFRLTGLLIVSLACGPLLSSLCDLSITTYLPIGPVVVPEKE